jgi:DNA end-binding protein Ku
MAKKTAVAEVATQSVADLSASLMTAIKPVVKNAVTETDAIKKLASRANWTGTLSFGMINIPVKTYTGTEIEGIQFNKIHSCGNKLSQQYVCSNPDCQVCIAEGVKVDRVVPYADQKKGFQYEEGKFVEVTKEELDSLNAADEKDLQITEFVAASSVDPIYFESTDYICPDKKTKKSTADKAFALLRAGMVARNVVAIGKRVKGGKEQTVVLRPYGVNGMVMSYMFFEHEVRGFDKWVDVTLTEQETVMAGKLVDAMTQSFKPETKFDTTIVRVKQLVASKIPDSNEVAPVVVKKAVPEATDDLMAALEASLSQAQGK